jgi:hypothetical protein
MNLFTYLSSIPLDEKRESRSVLSVRWDVQRRKLTIARLGSSCHVPLVFLPCRMQIPEAIIAHYTHNLPLCTTNPIDKSGVCALSFSKLLSLLWILIFTQSLFLFCLM